MDDSQLVRELTDKLETLQHEKQKLERAIEGQADSIALKLRLALLAAGEGTSNSRSTRTHHHHSQAHPGRRKVSSASPSSSISASSTTSTSSSTSFPSSPSPLLSPMLANGQAPVAPDVLAALRENSELRTRLANSERVNQYYQREIADLRRICGVSIDELEELDPRSHSYAPGSGTRRRSISSRSNGASGSTVGSIRIPGASSVSPPSIRPSTSSYPSQLGNHVAPYSSSYSYSQSMSSSAYYPSQNPRFLPHSYTSSINTTMTTPSSSFPVANPPAPTPSTSLDFGQADQTLVLPPDLSPLLLSPDLESIPSSISSSSVYSHPRTSRSFPTGSNALGFGGTNRSSSSSGLQLEDLVETSPNLPPSADTPTKLTVITSLDPASHNAGKNVAKSRGRNGHGRIKRRHAGTLKSESDGPNRRPDRDDARSEDKVNAGDEEDEDATDDPLVLAVTNSLKKLIAQNEGSGSEEGTIRRRIRRFSNEPQEDMGDEDNEGGRERGEYDVGTERSRGKARAASFGDAVDDDDDDEYTTDEDDENDDDDGSSTTSREEGKYEQLRAEITRLQRQVQMSQLQQRRTAGTAADGDTAAGAGGQVPRVIGSGVSSCLVVELASS
ncbi:hypothetical protein JCM3766R1_001015 [Sporobolomyces carnicolor]